MSKMSRAEAGRLGALASQATHQKMKQDRRLAYYSDPKFCLQCKTVLTYENRRNKFCSQKCNGTYQAIKKHGNKPKRTNQLLRSCIRCSKPCRAKYCSHSCSAKFRHEKNISDWLEGKISGHTGKTFQVKQGIRNYLIEKANFTCPSCGWDKRHPDGSSPLEIDHKNGDCSDSTPDNLRVLCPNCHSLTETFKARNSSSPRNRNGGLARSQT